MSANMFRPHPWHLIEEGFHDQHYERMNQLFRISNSLIMSEGGFAEGYNGSFATANRMAGLYQTVKRRYFENGSWKQGIQPDPFHLPACQGVHIQLDGLDLDIAKGQVLSFERVLNMQEGLLHRRFTLRMRNKLDVKVDITRFCCMEIPEVSVLKYSITPLNNSTKMVITPYLGWMEEKEAPQVEMKSWQSASGREQTPDIFFQFGVPGRNIQCCMAMRYAIFQDEYPLEINPTTIEKKQLAGQSTAIVLPKKTTTTLFKFVSQTHSGIPLEQTLTQICHKSLQEAYKWGFLQLRQKQSRIWNNIWKQHDIRIEGNPEAQRNIRYHLFQLLQSYRPGLGHIHSGPQEFGPVGRRWETEGIINWYYQFSHPPECGKELLEYRHHHLPASIELAKKHGVNNGAALIPYASIDGKEAWPDQILSGSAIHRNGALARAIFQYSRLSGDEEFLAYSGLEILVALSRFWVQRLEFSPEKKKYSLLRVIGPNEYEGLADHNWYSNWLAAFTLRYTLESIGLIRDKHPIRYAAMIGKTDFDYSAETRNWERILEDIYLPVYEPMGLFLQQEGYLNREPKLINDLDKGELPFWQNRRINDIFLQGFLQQADVLLGFLTLAPWSGDNKVREHFHFYVNRCLHEAPSSTGIHCTIAAQLGELEMADDLLQKSLEISPDKSSFPPSYYGDNTFSASAWLALIIGYGGIKIHKGKLILNPKLPKGWKSISFPLYVRGCKLEVHFDGVHTTIRNKGKHSVSVQIGEKDFELDPV